MFIGQVKVIPGSVCSWLLGPGSPYPPLPHLHPHVNNAHSASLTHIFAGPKPNCIQILPIISLFLAYSLKENWKLQRRGLTRKVYVANHVFTTVNQAVSKHGVMNRLSITPRCKPCHISTCGVQTTLTQHF